MARVPYIEQSQLAESDRDLMIRPINLFRALVNSPTALRNFHCLGEWIRWECELDPRLRELAILQVGYLTANDYEFSHHVKIGHDFGVSDDDIHAMIAATRGADVSLGTLEDTVLRVARELTGTGQVTDETYAALAEHLEPASIVDLMIVIGFYNAVVRVLSALRVDVEPEYQGFLAEFPFDNDQTQGMERV